MNTGNLVVREWMDSMQTDLDTVSFLSKSPLLAPLCYHCGQAVEKILKTYIIVKESKLIKTHDLDDLLERCENHSSDFSIFKKSCRELTTFSTMRYPPNIKLTRQDAEQAIKDTFEIVDFTKAKLKALGYD